MDSIRNEVTSDLRKKEIIVIFCMAYAAPVHADRHRGTGTIQIVASFYAEVSSEILSRPLRARYKRSIIVKTER